MNIQILQFFSDFVVIQNYYCGQYGFFREESGL